MESRPHLLLGGWYKPGSGFTRVLLSLLPFLQAKFRITWLGVGYHGEPFDLCDGVHVLPRMCGRRHGRSVLRPQELESARSDLVFVLNDLWYLTHYSSEFGMLEDPLVPMVGYLPLDGGIDNHSLTRDLTGFVQIVTYTNWACRSAATRAPDDGHSTPFRLLAMEWT